VNANEGFRNCATVCALLIGVASHSTFAQQPAAVAQPRSEAGQNENEGERDFDFQIGRWTTHLRRLVRPLAGSTTWAEYTGTTIARKVWDGRANLVELDVTGPAGRIEGLSLRLYNPESRQWSLHFSNAASGTMSPPTIGEFEGGRGEFYAQETINGRAVLVRFVITKVSANECRFEQAFSADGGKTWEINWLATDTRVPD